MVKKVRTVVRVSRDRSVTLVGQARRGGACVLTSRADLPYLARRLREPWLVSRISAGSPDWDLILPAEPVGRERRDESRHEARGSRVRAGF